MAREQPDLDSRVSLRREIQDHLVLRVLLPPPAQLRFLAAIDRPIQYDMIIPLIQLLPRSFGVLQMLGTADRCMWKCHTDKLMMILVCRDSPAVAAKCTKL
jgi:hypothetical protein